MYCVVVGDIIHSREMTEEMEREENRRIIEEIFDQINTKYFGDILSEFGIVRGDAFESVLYSAAVATDIVQDLIAAFWERCRLFIRVSIVTDRLTSFHLDRNKSDGPAFIRATKQIEEMKRSRKNHWIQVCYSDYVESTQEKNSLTRMIGALTKDWTDKQKMIAFLMPQNNDNQTGVAEQLAIKLPAVNKQIQSIDYYSYRNAWNSIRESLERMEKKRASESGDFFVEKYGYARSLFKEEHFNMAERYFEDAYEEARCRFGKDDIRSLPFLNGYLECVLVQNREFQNELDVLRNRHNVLSMKFDEAEKLDKNSEKTLEHVRLRVLKGDWYQQKGERDRALSEYILAETYLLQFYESDHPMMILVRGKIDDCTNSGSSYGVVKESTAHKKVSASDLLKKNNTQAPVRISQDMIPGRKTYSQRIEEFRAIKREEEP